MNGFDELKQEYIKAFPKKFAAMDQLIQKLRHNVDQEALKELRLYVHKMAGTAGMYGFPTISEVCKVWDQKLSVMLETFPACQKDLGFLDESILWLTKIMEIVQQHGA